MFPWLPLEDGYVFYRAVIVLYCTVLIIVVDFGAVIVL
jgi:hypothetical protein